MRLLNIGFVHGTLVVMATLVGAAAAFIVVALVIFVGTRLLYGTETTADSPGGGGGIGLLMLFMGGLSACFVGPIIGALTSKGLNRLKVGS